VDALASEGVTGPQAHLLLIAERGLPEEMLLLARGFNETDWNAAKEELDRAGLLRDRTLTEAGISLRNRIEATTDRLADGPFEALSPEERDLLSETLGRSAQAIIGSGLIPEENPIGLPVLH
jgi:hypothetical protein